MPTSVTAVRENVTLPETPAPITNPPVKVVPGFTAEGQPLPDEKVWGATIGKTHRPLNTADGHSGHAKIDGHERTRLLKIAKDDPRAFLTRLLADSMNGTPVDYSLTKAMKGFGVLTASFHMENGQFETKLHFEVYNKAVDQWLKPYLAKDARVKGQRSSAEVVMTGSVNMEAGIDNVKVSASGHDLPKLSADKITEIEALRKQLQAALKLKSAVRRAEGVKNVFEQGIEKMADFPLHFFLKMITDDDNFIITIKEPNDPTTAIAEVGDSKYSITFTDLLADANAASDEVKVGAKIAGAGDDKAKSISVEEVSVYNEHPLSLAWEEDKAIVYRTDPSTGTKTKIDDHAAELMGYLPLAMAFLANGGIS
jgi:hypothetical protein